jgi:RHS repeat-associated protein
VAPVEQLVSDGSQGYLHAMEAPLAEIGTSTVYPLTDALGSTRVLTGGDGSVIGSAAYDVFGTIRRSTGAEASFGFAGEQADENGLIYLRARYLDPELGRFLSEDPVRFGAPGVVGFNPYTYVGNNPSTWTDPTGTQIAIEYDDLLLLTFLVAGAAYVLGQALVPALEEVAEVIDDCFETGPCSPPKPPRQDPPNPVDDLAKLLRDFLRGSARRFAEQLAKACVAATAFSVVADTANPCTGGNAVLFHTERSIGGIDISEATEHIAESMSRHPSWGLLTKGTNAWVAERGSVPRARGWYDLKEFRPNDCEGRVGLACDEYPPLATIEGGPRSNPFPSLKPIDGTHNSASGATFGAGYTACPIAQNEQFLVVPIQGTPITGIPGGPGVSKVPSFWLSNSSRPCGT